MIDLFPQAMAFVWDLSNDGQPYHNTPNDPGGSTSWGVTFTTWAGWQRLHNAPVSMALFQSLKQADFQPLYRAMFWNSCRCGNAGPIGIQIFDVAVNSGPGVAARFLQTALCVTVDSEIGPVTLAALNRVDPAALNVTLFDEREAFYAGEPDAQYFERGWDRRAEACRDLVAGLINAPASLGAPPKPLISASQTLVDPRSENAETQQGLSQNPAISAAPGHDLTSKEITSADELNAAELAQLKPAPMQS